MFPQHSWPGEPHDRPDLFTPGWLVAVHRAFGTGRLFCPEAAALESHPCVGKKTLALRTNLLLMLVPAIDPHHGSEGVEFPAQTFAGKTWRLSLGPHGGQVRFN